MDEEEEALEHLDPLLVGEDAEAPEPVDPSLVEAMIFAGVSGNLQLAQTLVGLDRRLLDAVGAENSRTVLQCAAGRGHLDLVRYLLDQGAQINAVTAQVTALACACTAPRNSIEMVELLIQRGADVSGGTGLLKPLWSATLDRRVNVIRALLSHGCDVDENHGPDFPQTALVFACQGHDGAKTAQLLLDAGADPFKPWPQGVPYIDDGSPNAAESVVLVRNVASNTSCTGPLATLSERWTLALLPSTGVGPQLPPHQGPAPPR
jgi:hypothetical protein